MRSKLIISISSLALVLVSWIGLEDAFSAEEAEVFQFQITNLTDEQYPDNPDIGYRASNYQNIYFTSGKLERTSEAYFCNMTFCTETADSIWVNRIDLSEFIPTIPKSAKADEYLSYISCINQEWNRNQVKFNSREYNTSNKLITRVDIARNCLNAYLWEIIIYVNENGNTVPFAHGWFDFPHELYGQLFEQKNGMPFSKFQAPLEQWQDPASKQVKLSSLRTIKRQVQVEFSDESDAMYPLEKARKKKFKEIITPKEFSTMRDLQSDSTLFATFTPPGYYNRNDPRTTELGRFYNLDSIAVHEVRCNANKTPLKEVVLIFSHRKNQEQTTLVLGGLDFNEFPTLPPAEVNSGWKTSMGIGNHTFYEDYQTHNATKAENNPYYGLLLNEQGNWLDSHKVGIDGPIFHFGNEERTELHLWLLSFERHALVGHYVIQITE